MNARQSKRTAVIFPALVWYYVRCVVLCAACAPEMQARADRAIVAWRPWARVLLFTLLPPRRTTPARICVPPAYRHPVQHMRSTLRRVGHGRR